MKSFATAALLSLSVMAGAQAADTTPTRAQVQAELEQAKASGQYTFGEEGYPVIVSHGASLSSAQVQEELAQARNAGQMASSEQAYPPVAAVSAATPDRAHVRAELEQARDAGLVTFGNLDYPPTRG